MNFTDETYENFDSFEPFFHDEQDSSADSDIGDSDYEFSDDEEDESVPEWYQQVTPVTKILKEFHAKVKGDPAIQAELKNGRVLFDLHDENPSVKLSRLLGGYERNVPDLDVSPDDPEFQHLAAQFYAPKVAVWQPHLQFKGLVIQCKHCLSKGFIF